MSDCEVCLYADFDGNVEFFNKAHHVAAKEHRCHECRQPIPIGTVYEYVSGKFDGDFWTQKTCLICAEIADTFYCEGRVYGNLWEDMYEVMSELNTSCLARLKTPAAKAELQRRWIEWEKGRHA